MVVHRGRREGWRGEKGGGRREGREKGEGRKKGGREGKKGRGRNYDVSEFSLILGENLIVWFRETTDQRMRLILIPTYSSFCASDFVAVFVTAPGLHYIMLHSVT